MTKSIKEKIIGATGSASGLTSVLGSWQICHNLCLGIIALLGVIGISLTWMPLMFLTKIGIATPAFLEQKRKVAIVIILVVSALITPPDVITQLILSGPLIILYEIGLVVCRITHKKRQEKLNSND